MVAVATAQTAPPGLLAFMAALRQQESGGKYNEPNGDGAYQILKSNWPAWAREAGQAQWANVTPSAAPPAVQDAVAQHKLMRYYYGPAKQNWRLVARLWNGGTTKVVPNKALGPGATTDTYADQVLARMSKILAGGAGAGGASSSTASPAAAPASSTSSDSGHCYLKTPEIGTPGPFPAIPGICLDPLLWLTLIGIGAAALLAGAYFAATSMGGPKATKIAGSLAKVTPVGRAAKTAAQWQGA